MRPPRAARWLLRTLLPPDLRDAIMGDLEERYRLRALPSLGRGQAAKWFWKEVLRIRYVGLYREWGARQGRDRRSFETKGDGMMRTWARDLRHAFRGLRRRPMASAVVMITLALAVGVSTAIFSVVNGVLLRPLPYPEPDELVQLWQTNEEWLDSPSAILRGFAMRFPLSMPVLRDWEQMSPVFEEVGGYTGERFVATGGDRPERIPGQRVTSGLFRTLGVEPLLGRALLPEEDDVGSGLVAVLSYEYWQSRFAGDADVVGRTLILDDAPYTVVGVMPREFYVPTPGNRVWTNLTDEQKQRSRTSQSMSGVARLRAGVTMETAEREMQAVTARLQEAYPEEQGDFGFRMTSRVAEVVGRVRPMLLMLLGSVGLVLLIACANIANLLFVAGLTRRKELAVKAALGAGSRRLIRSLLAESAVLAALGGAGGLLLAAVILPALTALLPPGVPRRSEIGIDPTVLAFSLGVTALTAVLVGILPALTAARTQPAEMLSDSGRGMAGGRRGARTRAGLVVAEVALAFVLLTGAGLLVNSFHRLVTVNTGFRPEGVVRLTLDVPESRYPEENDHVRPFIEDLSRRLAALPGVESSAGTTELPLGGSRSSGSLIVEGAGPDGEDMESDTDRSAVIGPYFRTMGISIKEGRTFTSADRDGAPRVAVVSEAFAQMFWPTASALGKRFREGSLENNDSEWVTVVGVVGNVLHGSLQEEPQAKRYLPYAQRAGRDMEFVLATRGNAGAVLETARGAVWEADPELPISYTALMEDLVSQAVATPRFRTVLLGSLAGLAALLAILGVYGVVAFSVSQRVPEIGVRIALGAHPRSVIRHVLLRGGALVSVGVVLGLGAAIPATRLLDDFLFGVEPTDPLTFGAIATLMVGVGAAAAYLPARRAASVDPVTVLNSE